MKNCPVTVSLDENFPLSESTAVKRELKAKVFCFKHSASLTKDRLKDRIVKGVAKIFRVLVICDNSSPLY